MHAQTITCLNGSFLPADQALLPITDRGFRFGDGVFETIRLINGTPYQWELHLSRLGAGLQALRITPPMVDWKAIAREMMRHNKATDGYLRIAVSRGVGSRGYLPDADIKANWAMEYMPATAPSSSPCKLWLSTITRPALTTLPANHKLAQGIGSTLALLEARDHGSDDALMPSASGTLSEASSGNIFWLIGDQLFTPALATGCLAGTTRAAIMRLTNVEEVQTDINALLSANAAFVSNVRHGIWPIATLMPQAKSYDADHPRIKELMAMLNADCAAYVSAHAKDWA